MIVSGLLLATLTVVMTLILLKRSQTTTQGSTHPPLPCNLLYQNTCRWLKENPTPIIDQALEAKLINPTLNREKFVGEANLLLQPTHTNWTTFKNSIQPLFENLKPLAAAHVEQYPVTSETKSALKNRLKSLVLTIENRERCQRSSRPPVVGGSGEGEITLCPISTHQPIGQLVSLLAHEYGHIIDPCTLEETAQGRITSHPIRCEENDEVRADRVSVALTAAYFSAPKNLNQLPSSQAPRLRALYLIGFRFDTNCDTPEGLEWAKPWLSSPSLANHLGCIPE